MKLVTLQIGQWSADQFVQQSAAQLSFFRTPCRFIAEYHPVRALTRPLNLKTEEGQG